jgi:hypothetical protein
VTLPGRPSCLASARGFLASALGLAAAVVLLTAVPYRLAAGVEREVPAVACTAADSSRSVVGWTLDDDDVLTPPSSQHGDCVHTASGLVSDAPSSRHVHLARLARRQRRHGVHVKYSAPPLGGSAASHRGDPRASFFARQPGPLSTRATAAPSDRAPPR